MFLDETGITTNLLRRYGRAPRGARVHDHAPCGRWQTSTFLAALRVTGLTAPGVFDGAIDGESFRAYIEQILVPTLQPGDIVIADNLGAHKVAGIQRAIQAAGPPSGTCHPTARTSIPSSSASRSSRPSFAPLAVAAPRRSGRSSASVWRTSALTNAATIFGTAGTRPPHGHEKRFNLCLNHLSRFRARWRPFSDEHRGAGDGRTIEATVHGVATESPAAALERTESHVQLEQALRALPEHQRVPLVLFHFEDRSYQAIAASLGVSLGKVKTDIHRGREALRHLLADDAFC